MQHFNSLIREGYNNSGLTLVELIISICIFGLIVLGISSINLFSHYQVINSDRRAKLQNNASYVLEHMAKNITGIDTRGGAIGDINQTPVNLTTIGVDNAITVWIDANNNGMRDALDKQIAYRYSPAPNYQIWYYSNYTDNPTSYEVLTQKNPTTNRSYIRPNFSSTTSQPTYCSYSTSAPYNDYIEVQISACWDPAGTCGTPDNPALSMKNRIYMPAVSTN